MRNNPEQGSLFPDIEAAASKSAHEAIAERKAIAKALGPGKVYQGTCKTIRRWTASGKKYAGQDPLLDPINHAGALAALRQLAAVIDRSSGHNLTGWVANGRDLSALWEQYNDMVRTLDPTGPVVDEFDAWTNDDAAPKEATSWPTPAP